MTRAPTANQLSAWYAGACTNEESDEIMEYLCLDADTRKWVTAAFFDPGPVGEAVTDEEMNGLLEHLGLVDSRTM